MEQTKEYFAFISYKREDEKWAKWLQHKLEHYRLPVNVRKENPSLPQSIRPVFKDTSELAAGVLADEIHEALDNSKYLIVICSPRAAQSEWVGKEIQTFIDMGRSDKIIPFIIGGTPFSDDPEDECFPSALLNLPKEQELLGVNINEMGREAAVVKVVARMFGLKFDTLWQRYEREQKRKRWMWIGGSILLALFGLSIGGYFVRQNGIIERQNERLQQDSVTMAEHITRIQNDSIKLSVQKDSIQKTNTLLATANNNLAKANIDLREANYQILQERNGMLAAQSRAVGEKALSLLDDGDSYTARQIALAVLPKNLNEPDRPYIQEADFALRKASLHNTALFKNMGSKSVVFSPNGEKIVSANGNSITIIETQSGAHIKTLKGHLKNVTSVACSPNNKWIASGSEDCTIRIWDAQAGTEKYLLKNEFKHEMDSTSIFVEEVDLVKFSNDGKYLLSTSHMFDHSIKIWDVTKGTLYKTLKADASVRDAMFSPNGDLIISVSWQGKIIVWNAQTGERIKIHRMVAVIDRAAISPNGVLLAIGGSPNGLQIFDIQSDSIVMTLEGYVKSNTLTFSADNNYLLSASGDNTVRMWDLRTKKQIRIWEGHQWAVSSVCFHPDKKRFVSASNDGDVRLWDIENTTYHSVCSFNKHTNAVTDATYSPDGKTIASASWDKSIIIWDARTGQIINRLVGHRKEVEKVVFSPNGKMIASCSDDNTIRLWDVTSGRLIKDLGYHNNARAAFSPDGHYFASTSGETIIVRSTKNWQILNQAKLGRTYFTSISISPNSKFLVSSSYTYEANLINKRSIILWDIKTCKKIKEIDVNDEIREVTYSPDGKIIASTLGYDFALWNAKTGDLIHKFEGHRKNVTSICFSTDGKWMVSASEDNQIKVWNISMGALLTTLNEHTSFVESLDFSPSGNEFISASLDGTVKIWTFPKLQELIDDNQRKLCKRHLNAEDRRKYYLE